MSLVILVVLLYLGFLLFLVHQSLKTSQPPHDNDGLVERRSLDPEAESRQSSERDGSSDALKLGLLHNCHHEGQETLQHQH
jgi:hypothetical protein